MAKLCIIFSRIPEPGKTKTRLIPILGKHGAAQLHKGLIQKLLLEINENKEKEITYEMAVAGDLQTNSFSWLQDEFAMATNFTKTITIKQQQGQDLGQRMALAFATGFQRGYEEIILLGTDSPEITKETINQAFAKLALHDVVLGPTMDGGYILIGQKKANAKLFSNIQWSTDKVLGQTISRCKEQGLTVAKLSPVRDIDHPSDLQTLDLESFGLVSNG